MSRQCAVTAKGLARPCVIVAGSRATSSSGSAERPRLGCRLCDERGEVAARVFAPGTARAVENRASDLRGQSGGLVDDASRGEGLDDGIEKGVGLGVRALAQGGGDGDDLGTPLGSGRFATSRGTAAS